MASVSQVLRLFRLRSATPEATLKSLHTQPPLFQRNVPWWARWTWALIACDIFMTGSAIDLTWNHWSRPIDDVDHSLQNAEEKQDTIDATKQYTLRPVWQRGGLCVAHLGFGVGIAVALLVTHTRFVRTLAILPTSCLPKQGSAATEGPHVFIQCAHNFRKNGMMYPINKCSLEEGRNETELIFRTAGQRGHWYVGLEDAIICGHSASPIEARKAILDAWGGKRVGHWKPKTMVDARWRSGPIRRLSQ